MSRPGQFTKGTPKPEGSGRKPGQPNRVTIEFKAIIQDLIEKNQDKVAQWLEWVAYGQPEVRDMQNNLVRMAVPGDPAKALELLAKLGEFAAPKLARTEMTGAGGTPLMPPSVHLTVEGAPKGDQS